MNRETIAAFERRILEGQDVTEEEAYQLADVDISDLDYLLDAAQRITRHFMADNRFDTCSIINARSGRCPENCKWCAQSAHYKTSADVYPLVDRETCMRAADMNRHHGIHRFSLVTSGKALSDRDIDTACGYFREMAEQGGLRLCASMGLLSRESLQKLHQSGVERYHCNLETAPSFFPTLCTTHTIDQKLATIAEAHSVGLDICSGGIIGMGETRRQRVEFALTLRKVNPVSIPINVLQPIPGTPLENAEPLTQDEILLTAAIFRFIHPRAVLRFAGGRAQITRITQSRAMKAAVNGAIMGDMLTTIGSKVQEDFQLIEENDYTH